MKLRPVALLLGLLFVSACSLERHPTKPWPAYVEGIEKFSEDEKRQVLESLASLSQTAGEALFVFEKPQREDFFTVTISKVESFDQESKVGRAVYNGEDCQVEISQKTFTDYRDDMVTTVVWHELGHCAGLDHKNDRGVMDRQGRSFDHYNTEMIDSFIDSILDAIDLNA